MKRDLTLANVVRAARMLDCDLHIQMGDLKFQHITVVVRNNGGTLEHAYQQNPLSTGLSPMPMVSDRFRNIAPLGAFTATPTVGGATDFAAGAGIVNNALVLDTVPLDPDPAKRGLDAAILSFYSGNNTRVRAVCGFSAINVLGTTIQRFCFQIFNALTGAAVNITTTWLPTGKQAQFTYFGFL